MTGKYGSNIMQRVFDVIAQHGPVGVIGITALTGHSHETVRKAIARMRDRFDTDRSSARYLLYKVKPDAKRPADMRGAHMQRKVPA